MKERKKYHVLKIDQCEIVIPEICHNEQFIQYVAIHQFIKENSISIIFFFLFFQVVQVKRIITVAMDNRKRILFTPLNCQYRMIRYSCERIINKLLNKYVIKFLFKYIPDILIQKIIFTLMELIINIKNVIIGIKLIKLNSFFHR